MNARRRRVVAGAVAVVLLGVTSGHAFVLGGGSADGDCRVAFGGVDASEGASEVVCADGDATCDSDAVADGACRFTVSLCTAVSVAGCPPVPISAIALTGLSLPPPPLPSGNAEACGVPATIVVPAGTAVGATALARGDGELRDVDYLNLCCLGPEASSLAAARCALAVDLQIAGCSAVPGRARHAFARARALVDRAAASARPPPGLLRRARRALGHARDRGRKLAANDPCGFAIALIASHALGVITPPGATAATR